MKIKNLFTERAALPNVNDFSFSLFHQLLPPGPQSAVVESTTLLNCDEA